MTTSPQNTLAEQSVQHSTPRRWLRRAMAMVVADADSSADNSANQIALGSTWS